MKISPSEYEEFRRFLQDACGIVLGENKQYLVSNRLGHLMREFQIDRFATLMKRLKSDNRSPLHEQIVDAMTTNETLWFRDGYPFDILKQITLPDITRQNTQQLRIWSAASSSGQEAYAISMTLQEYLGAKPGALPVNIQILGTDISTTALREASSAVYDKMAMARGISEERKQRFFTERGEGWEVKPEIRNRVAFRALNLAQSYNSLGKFEIVFCRNVLIYFSSERKADILERIAQTMNPGGYLFLGGSESPMSYSSRYEMTRTPYGVVYRLKG